MPPGADLANAACVNEPQAEPRRAAGEAVAAALDRAIAKYGKLRDECLNANQFLSIDDSKRKIEAWRTDYNVPPLHSSLGQLSPGEFLRRSKTGTEKADFFQQ
jgi:transposase InsO family protein